MSAHEWAPGELDVEAAWREEADRNYELLDWEHEQQDDRMGRDDPVRTPKHMAALAEAKAQT